MKTGAEAHNWKGKDASYDAKHRRVHQLRGAATHCAWGCLEVTRYEWANLTGDYDDPYDFAQMCARCHKRFDAAVRLTADPHGVNEADEIAAYRMLALRFAGVSLQDIGDKFGVTKQRIHKITADL